MTSLKSGYFQTINYPSPTTILISDEIHGDHLITEPVLLDLLHSPHVLRLAEIDQHGVTGVLGLLPNITRLEHSIGAFLLVRSQGADLPEQVAALLHDISHTVFSHVIDWALSAPGEDSFHEVHKDRYVRGMTDLPEVIRRHGLDPEEVLREELFPLVEQPAPRLCADRVDYALRDTVALGKLGLGRARGVLRAMRAVPDARHPQRILALDDADIALEFSRAYIAADAALWGNSAHGDMYRRLAGVIRNVIRQGLIREEALWTLSDRDFWDLMRHVASDEDRGVLDGLEKGGIPDEDGLPFPAGAKVRTIDPDVLVSDSNPDSDAEIVPLSRVLSVWATEREEYIRGRERMRAISAESAEGSA
jgi:HD superfamily phosphohydrolase